MVETIEGGCPVCRADITGDEKALYFCKECNLLFSKASLQSRVVPVEKEEKQ